MALYLPLKQRYGETWSNVLFNTHEETVWLNLFFFFLVARSRLKWLNAPVKATEYKMERELDNSEPVLIKDMKPENEDKDEEVIVH